jgi:hypothetical protein
MKAPFFISQNARRMYKTCILQLYSVIYHPAINVLRVLRFSLLTDKFTSTLKGMGAAVIAGSLAFTPATAGANDDERMAANTTPVASTTTNRAERYTFAKASTDAIKSSIGTPIIVMAVADGYKEKFEAQQIANAIQQGFYKYCKENGLPTPKMEVVIDDGTTSTHFGIAFYLNGRKQAKKFDKDDYSGTFGFAQLREIKEEVFADMMLEFDAVYLTPNSPWYIGNKQASLTLSMND